VDALNFAIKLAEALREVHNRGRIYAFLQPSAVTLDAVKVLLAPCVGVSISPYFSPEQIAGRDLDARSDIFSLGAILYEMLSGRKAFDAPTKPGLRVVILEQDPAPLKNIPPAVARLVGRCLEKKPERRMQRMEILLAELKLQEIIARSSRQEAAAKQEHGSGRR
jgi:serine/threonine protein kinase